MCLYHSGDAVVFEQSMCVCVEILCAVVFVHSVFVLCVGIECNADKHTVCLSCVLVLNATQCVAVCWCLVCGC